MLVVSKCIEIDLGSGSHLRSALGLGLGDLAAPLVKGVRGTLGHVDARAVRLRRPHYRRHLAAGGGLRGGAEALSGERGARGEGAEGSHGGAALSLVVVFLFVEIDSDTHYTYTQWRARWCTQEVMSGTGGKKRKEECFVSVVS